MYKWSDNKRRYRSLDLKKDPKDDRDFKFKLLHKKRMIEAIPSKVDYTSEMSPVKSQGQLGSCVAFAIAALKEWQEQKEHQKEVEEGKKYHRDEKYYDLSESWIYWMAKKIDCWPHEEGTSLVYAMKVLNKIGVPVEKAWPYNDTVYGEPKKWAHLVARWSLVGSYERVENLEELKVVLAKSPVPIGIGCFAEIDSVGEDGIVPYPEHPEYMYGGHAITCVGFDDQTQLVKIKNSWGKNWGQQGYGYLPYQYINDFMWDAWTCEDISVTKEMLKGARSLIE